MHTRAEICSFQKSESYNFITELNFELFSNYVPKPAVAWVGVFSSVRVNSYEAATTVLFLLLWIYAWARTVTVEHNECLFQNLLHVSAFYVSCGRSAFLWQRVTPIIVGWFAAACGKSNNEWCT